MSGTSGVHFGRSDLLPNHILGNNESISKYSKFYIRGEFSRNCSRFSKSYSPQSYRLVERPKRKCRSRWYDTRWYQIQTISAPLKAT